jgi:hypothetical protein
MALTRDTDELYHVVVGRNGVESEEVVLTTKGSVAPAFAIGAVSPLVSLAAGFDHDGTLRVSVDERHMAWRDGRWSAPEPGPRCEQMVRAGRVLHCAYRETGSKLAPGVRIDWVISPAFLLPVPVPGRNTKLLLACRSALGWKPWAILEPAEQRDVRRFRIAGDVSGSVQVAYAVGWTQGLAFVLLSARTPALGSCDEVQPYSPITGIAGMSPGIFMDHDWSGRVDIATDPTSGQALIVAIRQYAAVGFLRLPDSISAQGEAGWRRDPWREDFWEVRLAPAARGRFHALFATNAAWSYARHAESTWSRPVPLLPYSRFVRDSTLLISNASNRALITWVTGDGKRMLAKWIEAAP